MVIESVNGQVSLPNPNPILIPMDRSLLTSRIPDAKLWGADIYHCKPIHFSCVFMVSVYMVSVYMVSVYMVSVYMVAIYMTQIQHRGLTSGLSWDCVQGTDFFA